MVKSPYVIEPGASVKEAYDLMRELEIRHLPVVENGELKGLVSERDLHPEGKTTRISAVMKTDLYAVAPDAPLSEVVGAMLDRKLGSALVVSPDKEVIGIFTTIDALGILYEMLDQDGEELTLDDYFDDWAAMEGA